MAMTTVRKKGDDGQPAELPDEVLEFESKRSAEKEKGKSKRSRQEETSDASSDDDNDEESEEPVTEYKLKA